MIALHWDCLAECDVMEAARYYDARQPGLGARFASAVAHAADLIREHPEASRRVRGNIRQRRVPGFPYAFLYRFDGTTVVIAVVTHLHRSPGWWKARTRD